LGESSLRKESYVRKYLGMQNENYARCPVDLIASLSNLDIDTASWRVGDGCSFCFSR
jgi:hypothetical protein